MSHASNDDFNAFGVTGRGIVTGYRLQALGDTSQSKP